jgi:hypothetical protein
MASVTARQLNLFIWSLLGLGVIACVALSVLRPRLVPTFNSAVRILVSSPWRRGFVVVGWMWLGWHLFAR